MEKHWSEKMASGIDALEKAITDLRVTLWEIADHQVDGETVDRDRGGNR